MRVARVWTKHGITPHRLGRSLASNDPEFESKATDSIGLYLSPPQQEAVFCVDEKTAIQTPRPQGSSVAVVAGAGGTAWVQIEPARQAIFLRSLQYQDR